MRESFDECFALVQESLAEISDIGQIRETTSEELSNVVQERLKVTVLREIVTAIREEVTRGLRITCRDESELARVKEVAEMTKAAGSRVLRNQWYPVKVDNACRLAVLDESGECERV